MSPAALFEKGEYRACAEECHRIIDQVAADGEILVLLIRSNANLGQLGEARLWAEKLIAKSGTHADDYFLYATILLELNELTEAEVALKKALYLEPDHLFVHLALGNVMKRLGKGQLAARHFRDTKVLLERFQDDEVVPDSDGLTAGRIREMIRITTETQRTQR
jgi:chemotaxis protein methyltransferase CheR